MVFVLLTYIRPLEEVDAYLSAHRAFLDRRDADGKFLFSGRRVPREGGLVLVDAASVEEARELLADDPFWREGLARYEFFPFELTRYDARFAPCVEPGYRNP